MSEKPSRNLNINRQGWRQFLTGRKQMLDAFDTAKAQDASHKTQTYRGRAAEAEFRKWLSTFLPKRYGVTSGYIISQGQGEHVRTPHFDVIIYDQLESPVLWVEENPDSSPRGSSRAIPAEHIRGVIEVKSSLRPSASSDAKAHLLELQPLLEDVDPPDARYRKYLPTDFFSMVVFFELTGENEYSEAALTNLIPAKDYRGFIGAVVLRGEVGNPELTGKTDFVLAHKQPSGSSRREKRSLFKGGAIAQVPYDERNDLEIIFMWSEAFFARFAFDIVALLDGTYKQFRLPSFHGFGMEWASTSAKDGAG